jgi:hypothetical protein
MSRSKSSNCSWNRASFSSAWYKGALLRIDVEMAKTGRNDPCPCGSGKKYKQCCLARDGAAAATARAAQAAAAPARPWRPVRPSRSAATASTS